MVGILSELLFQYRCCFKRRCVGLIGSGLRPDEVERVKNLRLITVRIATSELLVSLSARLDRRRFTMTSRILLVGCGRFDIVAFALGLRTDPATLVNCRLLLLRSFRGRTSSGEWI